MDQVVNVNVELHLTGSAKGIIEGGILVQGLSELEIECLPLDIPEFLEVDVSNLEDSFEAYKRSNNRVIRELKQNISTIQADINILNEKVFPPPEEEDKKKK